MHTAVIVCHCYLKAKSKPGRNYSNMISLQIRVLYISLQNSLLLHSNTDYYLMHLFVLCTEGSNSICCLSNFSVEKRTEAVLCSSVQTLVQLVYFHYDKLLTCRAPNARMETIIQKAFSCIEKQIMLGQMAEERMRTEHWLVVCTCISISDDQVHKLSV